MVWMFNRLMQKRKLIGGKGEKASRIPFSIEKRRQKYVMNMIKHLYVEREAYLDPFMNVKRYGIYANTSLFPNLLQLQIWNPITDV